MFQAAWSKPYVSRNDNVMGYTFWTFYKMKSSFEKSWLTQLIYPWKKQEKTQKSLLVQIIFGKISFLQFWKEGGKLETWTARWNLSTLTFESIYLKNMKKPTCIGTAQQKGGWEASPHSKGLLHHWANNVTYTKKKELEQYLFPNTRFTTIHYKHKHVFYDLWNPFGNTSRLETVLIVLTMFSETMHEWHTSSPTQKKTTSTLLCFHKFSVNNYTNVFDFENRGRTPPRIPKSRKKRLRKKPENPTSDFLNDDLTLYLENELRISLEVNCMYLI